MIFRPGLSPASHCQSPWIPAKAGMTSWRQTFVPHPLSQRACRFSGSRSVFQQDRSIRLGPPSSNPPPSLRRNRQPVDELQTGQFLQFSGRHFQLTRAAARSQSYHQANDWRIPRSTALLYFPSPSIFRFAVTDEFISRIEACLNHVQQTRGRQALVHQSPARAAH